MAKYINPFSASKEKDELDLIELAKQAGIKAPAQKKSTLEKIFDLLNAPSKATEKFLTGTKGYSGTLESAGIRNTKGELDANDVLSLAGQLVLDPLNLVAPLGLGAKAIKGIKAGAKVAGKINTVRTIGKAAEELFVPYSKLKRVSPQLAEALPSLEKLISAKQGQAVKKTAELGKEYSPEVIKNLGKLIEKGKGLTDEELSAVTKTKKFIQETITAPEKAAGIAPQQVANYFPRKAEREGVENLLKFGGKRLSLSLGGSEKARKFATQEAGEAAGVIYKDPLEALAVRASKSEAARANAGFLRQLTGGEVKDLDGNPLVSKVGKYVEQGYKEFSTKELRGFQAPVEAVDEVERYFKTFVSDDATNALLKAYDKVLGVWKKLVTSIFPAFHIRNALGNFSNMWLGGFNPQDAPRLIDAAKIQKGGSVLIKGKTITKQFLDELGLTGRGQFGYDIPGALADAAGKKNLLQKVNPFEVGRNVGTGIEDNSKIAFFLSRLGKGDDIKTAVAQTKKYLFDYSELTPFEKNVMRRLVPFYTWSRKNLPLQIESLITKPGRQAAISKTVTNANPLTPEEKESLPSYLTEGISLKRDVNEKTGDLKVISSLGLPIEDLGRLFRGSAGRTFEREIIGAMGPLGNALGIALKKDFYRGKETKELAYTYGRMAKGYPEPIKKLLEFKEEKGSQGQPIYRVNPSKMQIVLAIAPRILRTISEPSSGYEPFREGEYNLKSTKASKQKEIENQLIDLLSEKGIVKEFSRAYVPKEGGSSAKGKFINPF